MGSRKEGRQDVGEFRWKIHLPNLHEVLPVPNPVDGVIDTRPCTVYLDVHHIPRGGGSGISGACMTLHMTGINKSPPHMLAQEFRYQKLDGMMRGAFFNVMAPALACADSFHASVWFHSSFILGRGRRGQNDIENTRCLVIVTADAVHLFRNTKYWECITVIGRRMGSTMEVISLEKSAEAIKYVRELLDSHCEVGPIWWDTYSTLTNMVPTSQPTRRDFVMRELKTNAKALGERQGHIDLFYQLETAAKEEKARTNKREAEEATAGEQLKKLRPLPHRLARQQQQ